jgi:hypothetical protein
MAAVPDMEGAMPTPPPSPGRGGGAAAAGAGDAPAEDHIVVSGDCVVCVP